ncbi:PAS domain-containing protein [Pseudomonas [fluorescens] ATCC 17400]
MRVNLPVTTVEQTFGEQQRLISATDINSHITYCNAEFAAMSGFTQAELIGSTHNLVRHPDMPPAVFELMWRYLKAGQSWMGVVKNRCKNGNFYWVSAYVTPILEDGRLVGYESVRVKPTREQVKRAEALYARLRAGRSAVSLQQRLGQVGNALAMPARPGSGARWRCGAMAARWLGAGIHRTAVSRPGRLGSPASGATAQPDRRAYPQHLFRPHQRHDLQRCAGSGRAIGDDPDQRRGAFENRPHAPQ